MEPPAAFAASSATAKEITSAYRKLAKKHHPDTNPGDDELFKEISAAYDGQGEPFQFDLENLRGNGTGVGCSDLGHGRHLVGLQALPDGAGYTVRRTEIDLDGASGRPDAR